MFKKLFKKKLTFKRVSSFRGDLEQELCNKTFQIFQETDYIFDMRFTQLNTLKNLILSILISVEDFEETELLSILVSKKYTMREINYVIKILEENKYIQRDIKILSNDFHDCGITVLNFIK